MIAVRDEEPVRPADVERGATVECPECEGKMHVRSSYTTEDGVFSPRCFAHNPGSHQSGFCSGGESDTHKLMKYVAARALIHQYEHGTVHEEYSFTDIDRRADVYIEFDEPIFPFGRGVVAEVQHKNRDKEIDEVTADYLRSGRSVYWLNKTHFGDDFESVKFPSLVSAWPNGVPTPAEWTGFRDSFEEVQNIDPVRHPLPVSLPREALEEREDDLRSAWKIGAQGFSMARRLSSNNATRNCSECSETADYYLFGDGKISTFRCLDHIPEGGESLLD